MLVKNVQNTIDQTIRTLNVFKTSVERWKLKSQSMEHVKDAVIIPIQMKTN